jgi:PKD repeat protein
LFSGQTRFSIPRLIADNTFKGGRAARVQLTERVENTMMLSRTGSLLAAICLTLVSLNVFAAAPTAAISASPVTGLAPLGVDFNSSSSTNAVSFLWEFGDGAVSTAAAVTHIYNVSGTYIAKLTVTSADNQTASAQVTITVTGSGAGPVTPDVNFRWAVTDAAFNLSHASPNRDTFHMSAAFNTVDLPSGVEGLAASFSINNAFSVSGVMGYAGIFISADKARPEFSVQLDVKEQLLTVYITKASLGTALALSGATNTTTGGGGLLVPVTFTLTVGAQTYSVTEDMLYKSTAGASGKGQFNIKNKVGAINDGFFVISRASALENLEGTGHFYEFEGHLSRPAGLALASITAGAFTFKFNTADREVVLYDRIKGNGTKIAYDQSDRDLGGVRSFTVDAVTRRMTIRTWDIPTATSDGGTGLPLRGAPFTAYNFTIRLELDQPDGSTFQVVTATRLTRKTQDDAFWQTGRRRQQKK